MLTLLALRTISRPVSKLGRLYLLSTAEKLHVLPDPAIDVLYKRADQQDPKWTVRLKNPGAKGSWSAKTKDDLEAHRFAEELYYWPEGRARRGESIRAPTYKRLFEVWSRALVARDWSEKPRTRLRAAAISSPGAPRWLVRLLCRPKIGSSILSAGTNKLNNLATPPPLLPT